MQKKTCHDPNEDCLKVRYEPIKTKHYFNHAEKNPTCHDPNEDCLKVHYEPIKTKHYFNHAENSHATTLTRIVLKYTMRHKTPRQQTQLIRNITITRNQRIARWQIWSHMCMIH